MTSYPGINVCRAFYTSALIAFGIQHFRTGDFIAGRAPAWPAGIAGQSLFAYLSGAVLVITGLAVFSNKKARLALTISGILILVWAGIRNIYQIALHPEYGALLTNTFKALTLGSGAFVVAHSFTKAGSAWLDQLINRFALIGKYIIALFLLVGGVQHFLFADFVKYLVPTWIPGALFWTYFAGVALIATGLGLITNIKSYWAALLGGWMVLAWVLVLHLPRVITYQNQNEWTAVFEALAFSGILFLLVNFKRHN